MSESLRVAHVVSGTRAEGPGLRFALWLAGCRLRCPGCCNPTLFDARAGRPTSIPALMARIERAQRELGIEGVTVLGGEPLDQMPALATLCEAIAAVDLGVIVFTGYARAQVQARAGFDRLWASIDTLVDGRFDAARPEPSFADGGRRWIGSSNQRLWHRTGRYRDPAHWRGPNHVELRVAPDGAVSVHGFPSEVDRLLRLLAR